MNTGLLARLEPFAVIGSLVALVVAGYVAWPLHSLGFYSRSFGIEKTTTPRTLVTLAAIPLCHEGGGDLTVTGLHFTENDGVQIVGWATRPSKAADLDGTGYDGGLVANGFDPTIRTVTVDCSLARAATELAIEVQVPDARDHLAQNLVVDYGDHVHHGSQWVGLDWLRVCADPHSSRPCWDRP